MSWTLLVTSHGRWPYLKQTLESVSRAVDARSTGLKVGLGFFDRLILSIDGTEAPDMSPRWEIHKTGGRQGLTANLTQAWAALGPDEWVFHVEEDWLIRDAPLEDMAACLAVNPTVANMVLLRDPVSPEERRAGSVLGGQHVQGRITVRDVWLEHSTGFWLNPCVYRSDTVRGLVAGVEDSLTRQCLNLGLSFGYWGSVTDSPRCAHLGVTGGMGSPGWKP
jgi:hypothetical protein